MKKIMIPIDFSEENQILLNFVGKITQGKQAEVTLYHHMEYPSIPGNFMNTMDFTGDFYQERVEMARTKLMEMANEASLNHLNVVTQFELDPGTGAEESICAYAEQNEIDLLLLISKHRKGAEAIFPGSILMRVIRDCRVPMIILGPETPSEFTRIAYATDFSDESARFFEELRGIAEFFNASFSCFTVTTPENFQDQRELSQASSDFINKIGFAYIPEIKGYNAWTLERGIEHFAEDNLVSAIAVATHGRKGISRLFNRSITENLLAYTSFPLIVINMKEE